MKLSSELISQCPNPTQDGLIWKNVSDEIKLEDGKANPCGWSYYRLEWKGETVGHLNSGTPEIIGKNWQMTDIVDPSDGLHHVFFFKGMTKDDWDAIEFMKK